MHETGRTVNPFPVPQNEWNEVFHVNRPDFEETRESLSLLVWGSLAQWMVVDPELLALLKHFDGRRSLRDIIDRLNSAAPYPTNNSGSEALDVVRELLRRGILTRTQPAPLSREEPIRLANITVNITNRCNLRCVWCYNAGRTTEEIPAEVLGHAIRDARTIFDRDTSLIILGGEPFLDWRRLRCFLEQTQSLFAGPTLISTNGTLLTEDALAELSRFNVEVQVSLDSPTAGTHNAIRGEGAYERTLEGVCRLVAAGIHTTLSMVYTRENYEELERFLDLSIELRVNEARCIPLRQIGHGLLFRSRVPNQFEVFKYLVALLAERPELRALLRRDFFSILYTTCRESTVRQGCGIGRRVIFVDADGRVYPCPNHVDPSFECGRIPDNNLADILMNSSKMMELRNIYNVARYKECRGCAFRSWCAGDCRGETLAVTGTTDSVSPHCEEMKSMLVEMMWLAAQNDNRFQPSTPGAFVS